MEKIPQIPQLGSYHSPDWKFPVFSRFHRLLNHQWFLFQQFHYLRYIERALGVAERRLTFLGRDVVLTPVWQVTPTRKSEKTVSFCSSDYKTKRKR